MRLKSIHLCYMSMLLLSVLVSADCPKPEVPDYVFALSSSLSSYSHGYVYEVVCVPGYSPSSVTQLVCEQSNAWQGNLPHCEKNEIQGRWWLLLVLVTAVIVAVPCIVPRIYYSHYVDEPFKSATKGQQDTRIKPNETELRIFKSWPPSEAGKMKQASNVKLDSTKAQVKAAREGKTDAMVEIYPVPLPPIKGQHKMPSLSWVQKQEIMVESSQRFGRRRLPPVHYSDNVHLGRDRNLDSTC